MRGNNSSGQGASWPVDGCQSGQLDQRSGPNKDANEVSGEPAAQRNTVDGGSPKKDRIHQVSSQHVEQD